jgi:hypothetical protein
MASLDLRDLVGGVTGSEAARAKLAGALVKVQGALESKAEILGQKVPFLGTLPAALSRGTAAARVQEADNLAKETIGVTLTEAKGYGAVLAAALGGILLFLILRRRGG